MNDTTLRRKDRALDREAALRALDESLWGTLSMCAPDGTPYGCALHFVRNGESLYFHAAEEGLKTELLRQNPRVCALFVREATVMEQKLTTHYVSVLVRGTAREITDGAEKCHALRLLCAKFAPSAAEHAESTIQSAAAHTAVWCVEITSVTGKANPLHS